MTEAKKMLESSMKIRFHDCDPFKHLNNSRYIDYIMVARGDQILDNYGFDLHLLGAEQGLGWVMGQTQISYQSPAVLNEEVMIQTRLLAYTNKTLLMEAMMWNKNKTQLKAILWGKLVHFNLATGKSHTHSMELLKLFEDIVYPDPLASTFEERVSFFKSLR